MADMESTIRSILTGTPHAVQKIGPLWQIRVGQHAGARTNGVSLAQDLLAKYHGKLAEPKADVPVETVREVIKEVPGPERVVYKDRVEYVQVKPDLAKLEEAADALRKAKREAEASKPMPGDMFDLSDLTDLLRENEPHAESQDRFRVDYIQLTSRMVDPRVTPLNDDERKYQKRLQAALYSGRRGAVEIV